MNLGVLQGALVVACLDYLEGVLTADRWVGQTEVLMEGHLVGQTGVLMEDHLVGLIVDGPGGRMWVCRVDLMVDHLVGLMWVCRADLMVDHWVVQTEVLMEGRRVGQRVVLLEFHLGQVLIL